MQIPGQLALLRPGQPTLPQPEAKQPPYHVEVTPHPRGLAVHGQIFQATALGNPGIEPPREPRADPLVREPLVSERVTLLPLLDDERHSLELSVAAARVLAAALDVNGPPVRIDHVRRALCALLRGCRKGLTERALVGFLMEAIKGDRGELIGLFVDTIASAAPGVISAQRRLCLLMGSASPMPPSDWVRNLDKALAAAGEVGGLADRNMLRDPPNVYMGPPLLARLCKVYRDAQQPVSPEEGTRCLGIHAFLSAVLASRGIEISIKRRVVLSDFESVRPAPNDDMHQPGERATTASAAQVAVQSRQFGAACAVLHALSMWEPNSELQSDVFRQMRVDWHTLSAQIDDAAARDAWFGAVKDSWTPSILELERRTRHQAGLSNGLSAVPPVQRSASVPGREAPEAVTAARARPSSPAPRTSPARA